MTGCSGFFSVGPESAMPVSSSCSGLWILMLHLFQWKFVERTDGG